MYSKYDLVWFAGLYDGEGYCRWTNGSMTMGLTSTDKDLVERAAALVLAPIHARKKLDGCKQAWEFRIHGMNAHYWGTRIRGFVCQRRREQLDAMLSHPQRGSYGKMGHQRDWQTCSKGHEYTDENTLRLKNNERRCRTCTREKARTRRAKT